jgi:hypothetical protein
MWPSSLLMILSNFNPNAISNRKQILSHIKGGNYLNRSAAWRFAQGQRAPSPQVLRHTPAPGRVAGGSLRNLVPQANRACGGLWPKQWFCLPPAGPLRTFSAPPRPFLPRAPRLQAASSREILHVQAGQCSN